MTTSENMVKAVLVDSKWFVSRGFDYSLILGGAALTLAIPLAVWLSPLLLPIFFWIWIICFEGAHFFSTWTRTYLDQTFFRENKALMFGSLVFFVAPMLAGFLNVRLNSSAPLELYGFGLFCWSLYHNARQHFGFISIYLRKSQDKNMAIQKSILNSIYLAVVPPQIFFLLKFKLALAFPEAVTGYGHYLSNVAGLMPAISVIALLFVAKLYVSTRAPQKELFPMHIAYSLGCLIFYAAMFYWIAPREPFFKQAQNGAQMFMMIAVMNSLFHNIQYLAIVWVYGSKRSKRGYSGALAGLIHRGPFNYLIACWLAGLGFAWIVWNLGDWTSPSGEWIQKQGHLWAIVSYFGIVGHHFFLDQKIWRVSRQRELQNILNLKEIT